MKKNIDYTQILSKEVANEGIVLLKNSDLPLNGKVNIFGRSQFNYYKSGTGSGGLVNTGYVYSLYDIISSSKEITINENLVKIYQDFIKENPFNHGNGTWASEPWSQVEMPVTKEIVKNAKSYSDTALVVIGRTAGEDKDFKNERGSYKLSLTELEMIKTIKEEFSKIILVLNIGTIIDLTEIIDDVSSVLLAYHGGYYGALSIYETLIGLNNPSGSLPFTIIKDFNKDPTFKNFGNKESLYQEDIYLGYRYYHTFNLDNVLFPLGFGLSYTTFSYEFISLNIKNHLIDVVFKVKNTGTVAGKKAYLFYLEKPNNKIKTAKYTLSSFFKTKLLNPNEEEIIKGTIDLSFVSNFDEEGAILKDHYLLEKGSYNLFLAKDLNDQNCKKSFILNDDLIFSKGELLPLEKYFKKLDGKDVIKTALKNNDKNSIKTKYIENDYTFNDIDNVGIDKFIEGLTDEDLTHLIKGEGMSSPKGTPGIAAVVGGLTERTAKKEIPIIGFADGPSGIRMDSGFYASSLPNGALMASTFNLSLIEKLYKYVGYEMNNYNIQVLLGPGMNIYRNHLCGRNFEYFSEDPLLTGLIASSVIKGLHQANKYGSLKHLMLNNQETFRFENEVWVSNRAIREIYLRPFEIAIKLADVKVIMSSYNYINGYHSLSHPTLFKIVKEEFGFDGIFISDWWAHVNDLNKPLNKTELSKMVLASHELYMVTENTVTHQNDLKEALKNGVITRDDLVVLVKNILTFIKNTDYLNLTKVDLPKLKYLKLVNELEENEFNKLSSSYLKENNNYVHFIKKIIKDERLDIPKIKPVKIEDRVILNDTIVGEKGLMKHFNFEMLEDGKYVFLLKLRNEGPLLSQLSLNIYFDGNYERTYTYGHFNNTLNASVFKLFEKGTHSFSVEFRQTGLIIEGIEIFKHP